MLFLGDTFNLMLNQKEFEINCIRFINICEIVKLQMDAIKILQNRNLTINQRLKNFYKLLGGKFSSEFNLENHTLTSTRKIICAEIIW